MPARIRYGRLPTEQLHPRTRSLDRLPITTLLRLMNAEDARVIRAVGRARPQVARGIHVIATSLHRGGRLLFIGAGTSGRLGIIEAAECPTTFHTNPDTIQAIMAGGRQAVFRSREGAEDRRDEANAIIRRRARPGDVVVGISASGVTPFVEAGLRQAARRGAATILITCHPRSAIPADLRIALRVGPEILAGSTRLKAGTATKLVLNMLTLGAMIRLGKTHGNLMADVKPTSNKLRARAVRIIQSVARCSKRDAARALAASRGQTRCAVLMASRGLTYAAARRLLRKSPR